MRCFFEKAYRDIQFDMAAYQQFLRECEDCKLSEYDIKHLNIRFITDFTRSHFTGCAALAPDGAFFQREREYVATMNEAAGGFYKPYDPPDKFATIFVRSGHFHLPIQLMNPTFLNALLLHETRHHIQHCRSLPWKRPVDAIIDSHEPNERNYPWEKDAEDFAYRYGNRISFLTRVSHPPTRSELYEQ